MTPRLIGMLLFGLCCVGLGVSRAMEYRKSADVCHGILLLFYEIREKTARFAMPLSELLQGAAPSLDDPDLEAQIKSEGSLIPLLSVNERCLPRAMHQLLSEVIPRLGKSGFEGQMALLDRAIQEMEPICAQMQASLPAQRKVCICVGSAFGGLFVLLML